MADIRTYLRNKIKGNSNLKNETQGLALRKHFFKDKKLDQGKVFLEYDYTTKNDDVAKISNNAILGAIYEEILKNENNKTEVYFRINISNRHWVGCKISVNKNKKITGVTVFDSSNHVSKDKEIAKKIINDLQTYYNKKIKEINTEENNNELKKSDNPEIKVKQLVKNSKNNCVFETEMAMMVDAGIITGNDISKYGLRKSDDATTELKTLDIGKIVDSITEEEVLVKMIDQSHKDKQFLSDVITHKNKIINIPVDINGKQINVTKIGVKYYLITDDKKLYELSFIKDKKQEIKPIELNYRIFNYITNKLRIKTNKQSEIDGINIDKQTIQKQEFLEELYNNKIQKLYIDTKICPTTILYSPTFGYFVVGNNNEIYSVKENSNNNKIYNAKENSTNQNPAYKIQKPALFTLDNDYFKDITKVEDLDNKVTISNISNIGNYSKKQFYINIPEIQGTGIERMNEIVENEVVIEEIPMDEEEVEEEVKSF